MRDESSFTPDVLYPLQYFTQVGRDRSCRCNMLARLISSWNGFLVTAEEEGFKFD
jgi:hypothetical protein